MKKKLIIALCALLVIAVIAFAVLNLAFRKITVVSGRDEVWKCPRYARPGQEVTVLTSVVDDADIFVSGVDGTYVSPGVYVFTMPDEDVHLKVTVVAFPYGS